MSTCITISTYALEVIVVILIFLEIRSISIITLSFTFLKNVCSLLFRKGVSRYRYSYIFYVEKGEHVPVGIMDTFSYNKLSALFR